MSSLIYKGDVGAQIEADTQNLSSPTTTTFTLIVEKPSGATVSWSGVMNYTTGSIVYTTIPNDLDESGQWVVQVKSDSITHAEMLKSDKDTFTVYDPVY